MVALCAFAAHGVFQLRPENWPGVAAGMIMFAVAAAFASHWCRRQGWTMRHELAATAGPLLTCAWCGFVATFMYRGDDALAWTGNVLFLVLADWLVVTAARRIGRQASEQVNHRQRYGVNPSTQASTLSPFASIHFRAASSASMPSWMSTITCAMSSGVQ